MTAAHEYNPWSDERVRAVCVSTGCLMLGHGVATPVLPAFAADIGGAATDVGLALAAFGAARLALNLPVGAAVNTVGRKPVLVGGAMLSAVGMAASGFAVDVPTLLASRLVAGAGASCYLGGVQVYLTDIAPAGAQHRVMGANHSALLFGVSAGPMLGGLTAEILGLRAPFVLIAALNGAAGLHAFTALRETMPTNPSTTGRQLSQPPGAHAAATSPELSASASPSSGWSAAMQDGRFVSAGVAHAANFAMRQGGRNMLLALVAIHQFGYSSGELGALFGAMAAVDLLAVGAASRAADRAQGDPRGVVVPGMLGSAAACAFVGLIARDMPPDAAVAAVAIGEAEAAAAIEAAASAASAGSVGSIFLPQTLLHPAFLLGVVAWAASTASVGPTLPAFASGLARVPAYRGAYVALFRTWGDIGSRYILWGYVG